MRELEIDIINRNIVKLQPFVSFFKELKDGKYLITVKDIRKRSIQQNRYYWGVVVYMCMHGLYEIGYEEVTSLEDAHEILKKLHLTKQYVHKTTGACIEIARSTAKLSIAEFNDYLERICRWASEFLGIYIPSPNEQYAVYEHWQRHAEYEADFVPAELQPVKMINNEGKERR